MVSFALTTAYMLGAAGYCVYQAVQQSSESLIMAQIVVSLVSTCEFSHSLPRRVSLSYVLTREVVVVGMMKKRWLLCFVKFDRWRSLGQFSFLSFFKLEQLNCTHIP